MNRTALPARPRDRYARHRPHGVHTMSGAILVVEDEPITQRLIAANLERAGHRVMRAASVTEAMASIREVVPDLVLLDWILPNATGVSFARQLRTDQRTRDVPIIMLRSE